MDYNRQLELFNPNHFKESVHVIGAGATGSWLVLMLAKMGIKDISVYDYDVIEEHNIPNQLYGPNSVGKPKVNELQKIVFQQTGIRIKALNKKIESSADVANMNGYIFVLVDSMSFRKSIYTDIKKRFDMGVIRLIETRMGLEHGRIYSINPRNKTEQEKYEATLYTDEDSVTSACGSSQSIAITAIGISQLAIWEMLKVHLVKIDKEKEEDVEINNEFMIDYKTSSTLTTIWD